MGDERDVPGGHSASGFDQAGYHYSDVETFVLVMNIIVISTIPI